MGKLWDKQMHALRNGGIKTMHEKVANEIVQKALKMLHEPNGQIQSLWLNLFSSPITSAASAGFNSKPTEELNIVLKQLQEQGYKIIDIKFNSAEDQGLAGSTILHILILLS